MEKPMTFRVEEVNTIARGRFFVVMGCDDRTYYSTTTRPSAEWMKAHFEKFPPPRKPKRDYTRFDRIAA